MKTLNDILFEAKKKGYYVDDDGKVFSSKKQLSLRKAQNRYYFTIRYYGQRTTISVHKFVGYLKYGDIIFNDGVVVRHLDGDSLNNSWENIGIGTQSDNMMDIPQAVRIKKAINASSKRRRFSNDDVQQIICDRKSGMTYQKICEKYNTSKSTLSYLFNKAYYSGASKIE